MFNASKIDAEHVLSRYSTDKKSKREEEGNESRIWYIRNIEKVITNSGAFPQIHSSFECFLHIVRCHCEIFRCVHMTNNGS